MPQMCFEEDTASPHKMSPLPPHNVSQRRGGFVQDEPRARCDTETSALTDEGGKKLKKKRKRGTYALEDPR